jgi:hypothetical protein
MASSDRRVSGSLEEATKAAGQSDIIEVTICAGGEQVPISKLGNEVVEFKFIAILCA